MKIYNPVYSISQLLNKFLWVAILCSSQTLSAQKYEVNPEPFADNFNHWYMGVTKNNLINPLPDRPKYKPTEITNIADNILLYQKVNGGWEKNYDVFAILTAAQKDTVTEARKITNTTYDNGSTYTQIAVLANVYTATNSIKYKKAAIRGFEFILQSQYRNGGFPQYYPLEKNYSKEITFNDGVLEGIVELLKDVEDNKPEYTFIDIKLREKLIAAYEKALDCIIKTQINDGKKPTAWCQQYDEVTLQPAWARKFEPPSICNKESADLVIFLMSLDHPSKKIIAAVQNAVTWFQDSKINNTRINTISAELLVSPFRISTTDKVVVTDTTAPSIWTRYYELKTHKPMFCDRDSKIVYSLAEITRERRDGYAWYTYAPQKVLNEYPAWKKKWANDHDLVTNQ